MTPHFRHLRRAPSGPVAAVIDACWTVEAATCTAAVEGVLPDDSVELYFNLGPHGRRPYNGTIDISHRRAWIAGPRANTVLIAKETRDCLIIGVRLRAGTASHLLGAAASEFTGQLVDIDTFWHNEVESIRDQMACARNAEQRFEIAERAVMRQLTADTVDGIASARRFCAATGAIAPTSVGKIAATLGVTHRQLITSFDQHVGLKPKEFQRVHRLRRVLPALASKATLASVAASAGYFDEAHFVHDFRKLTGLTPREYTAKRMSIGHGSFRYITAN